MARDAVAYSDLVPNGVLADPSGTALTSGDANGGQIADAVPELTVLRVVCGATGGDFVVLAGDNPPALAAGQGDRTETFTANEVNFVGPFESGRFVQSDGSMEFTCTQAMTVTALRVPRNT